MKIVTLTLSAAYDVHCHAEKIEVGCENFATLSETNAGGKGINISRALLSYGISSTAVVVLGEENSREFCEKLESGGVTFEKILVPGKIRENITVHTSDGKETRISFGGTEAPKNLISEIERITDALLSEGDILTFTGSIPSGVDKTEAKKYANRLREKGIRVIVDSRSFSLSDLLEMKPFLIKPNEYELEAYIGAPLGDEFGAIPAAEKLRALGIENVMISLGEKGAVLSSSEGSFYVRAPKINTVSTIGAGDSSIAGFTYALSQNMDMSSALKYAVAFGSAACLEAGTEPPRKSEILKILENGSF